VTLRFFAHLHTYVRGEVVSTPANPSVFVRMQSEPLHPKTNISPNTILVNHSIQIQY